MILAVTMNPSVDICYPLDTLKLNDVNRVGTARKTAGGKGLNVARVISLMEKDVLATGVLGGTLGRYIVQELKRTNIRNDFLTIEKETRNCIAILHDGMQTELLEAGPELSDEEGTAFLEKFKGLLVDCSIVTISGSLPKGLPTDFYSKMAGICRGEGIPAILDTSGEPLKQALLREEKPFAIKPNLTELAQLTGGKVENDIHALKKALSDKLFEGIEWVVVTLGSEGAFVKREGTFYRVAIPKVEAVNPVGSGDATVAGLAVGLSLHQPVEAVLKTALAAGILNAMEAETGHIDYSKFEDCLKLIEVEKIEA